ncbi:hypothetical protein BJV74DRAFT_421647 [Russula compacta]|nr:hypothetical protein BJV74DRAFT_421647 [Russula compacta]
MDIKKKKKFTSPFSIFQKKPIESIPTHINAVLQDKRQQGSSVGSAVANPSVYFSPPFLSSFRALSHSILLRLGTRRVRGSESLSTGRGCVLSYRVPRSPFQVALLSYIPSHPSLSLIFDDLFHSSPPLSILKELQYTLADVQYTCDRRL